MLDRVVVQPSYIIFKDAGKILAKNGKTGKTDYSGTDASTVIQSALNAISRGVVFICDGDYTLSTELLVTGDGKGIMGAGGATKLTPPSGGYAISLGDGTTEYIGQFVRDIYINGSGSAYNGIRMRKSARSTIENVYMYYLGKGLYIYNCDNPRIYNVTIWRPMSYGIHCEQPSGVVNADYWFRGIRITQDTETNIAKGIYIDTGVNGVFMNDVLVTGSGISDGITFSGSASSGSFLNNVVVDNVYGDGIKFLGTTNRLVDVLINNSWIMSCRGYGLYVVGSSTQIHYGLQVSNSVIRLNYKAGVRLEHARHVMFQNCRICDNFLENTSGAEYDTNLLIKGNTQATFDHCWFMWHYVTPSNRGRVVKIQITSDNPNPITVKFSNCFFSDISDSTKGRIGYGRDTTDRSLYIYLRDALVKDSTRSYDDLTGNGASSYDEVDTKLGATFQW
ncbi:MAG: right-handed parallel beta-helix repeat-containing protein [Candidatus Bathyarchaeia archaeon]